MVQEKLHRYTSFSSLVHILHHRAFTLLDPQGWDDRNDAYFIEAYRRRTGATRIFALCFTEAQQKYHHWNVFAAGADGVCISLKKRNLIKSIHEAEGDFEFHPISYLTAQRAKEYVPFSDHGLRFTKNLRYSDEKEWRLIFDDHQGLVDNPSVSFGIDIITRITLSPWLPKPLVNPLKTMIKSIPGCEKIDVRRSTLIDYYDWKSIADQSIS